MFGTVKWFSDDKGFGFLACEDGSPDVFVHHSSIEGQQGRRTLTEGQRVEFEVHQGDRSPEAKHLHVV